jgi:hypothetical protein
MPRRPQRKRGQKRKGREAKSLPWLSFLVVCAILVSLGYFFYSYRKGAFPEWLPAIVPFGKVRVYVYFGDTESASLVGEERSIQKRKDLSRQLEDVLSELMGGPKGDLIQTIPPQAVLQEVRVDKRGLASVSFSRELSTRHPGGSQSEILTVYSIVDTLTLNFPEITKVQLLLDHKKFKTLAGHIDCSRPLGANRKLIKETTSF